MGEVRVPAVWMAHSLGLGIWLGWEFRPEFRPVLTLPAIAILLIGLAYLRKHNLADFPGLPENGKVRRLLPYLSMGLTCLVSALFGMWVLWERLPDYNPRHYIHATGSGPAELAMIIGKPLKTTGFYWRWNARVTHQSGQPSEGGIVLQMARVFPLPQWLPGDQLHAVGQPEPFPQPSNPYQFNYAAFMETLGIHARLRLEPGSFRHTPKAAQNIADRATRWQNLISLNLDKTGLTPESKALIRAIVLGDRSTLDAESYQSFRMAGAAHILAVSGLHVGLLMGLAGWFLWPLRRVKYGRSLHFAASLAVVWAYALVTGGSASVVRASLMFSFLAYGLVRNRKGESIHFLSLAALVMLGLVEPRWLLQAGFQMSFAAVWAILVFYPQMIRYWPWRYGLGQRTGQLLCVSFAAQLGVLPISLYYFHQLPLLFWLSSLLLLPMLGAVLAAGTFVLALATTWKVPGWLVGVVDSLLAVFTGIVDWIGARDAFVLEFIPWDGFRLILAGAALCSFGHWLQSRRPSAMTLCGATLLCLSLWGIAITIGRQPTSEWWIPHRVGSSAVAIRQGRNLAFYTNSRSEFTAIAGDLQTGKGLDPPNWQPLPNHFHLGGERLFRLDSTGIYGDVSGRPDYLFLTGSPRVHPGPVLDSLSPGMVIADGSNYTRIVEHWKTSCRERGIPFHATREDGAFYSRLPNRSNFQRPLMPLRESKLPDWEMSQ